MAYKGNISVICCTCEVAVNCCALCCLTMSGKEEKPSSCSLPPAKYPSPNQSVPWAWGEWHEIQSLLKMCIISPTTPFVPNIEMEYLDKMCNTYLFWKCYLTYLCPSHALEYFFLIWLSNYPKISCKIPILFILPLIHLSLRIFFQALATYRNPINSNGCYLQLKKGK